MKRFIRKRRLLFGIALLCVCLLAAFLFAPRQPDPRRLLQERQAELDQIAAWLQEFGLPRVHVTPEEVTTCTEVIRIPDGRYFWREDGPSFETDAALARFMGNNGIDNISYTVFDELELTVFSCYNGWHRGIYYACPDMPTEKAYTSFSQELTPAGDGWEYLAFGDRYYTEKLCDGWYFYEVDS